MEVKLSHMQVQLNMKLLALKCLLINHKKEGTLFFKEDVTNLQRTQLFQIYFFQKPGPNTFINAFPIPIKEFQFYKNNSDHYFYMKSFFEKYYGIIENDLTFFEQYDIRRPFVGRRFIWYHFV
ncbi:hypothetical protein [Peribacillus sp. Bi134]|uniref:hypothetical protein n=1 Tax=Peribacillus sp. Bi134 TaxID=2884272 RepID=UPI001D32DC35|nr:hypothetical protein [Peribacillus sp. Bi134]CAH0168513.1 hypothetical protein SRABI134_01197 [Peribacillus sp. Bi134]